VTRGDEEEVEDYDDEDADYDDSDDEVIGTEHIMFSDHRGHDFNPPVHVKPTKSKKAKKSEKDKKKKRKINEQGEEDGILQGDLDQRLEEKEFAVHEPAPAKHQNKPKLIPREHHDEGEELDHEEKKMAPLLLAAAADKYLETIIPKFLENDISVTKFLEQSNDVTVTKFLDTTVTKFLDDNDISVTKFLEQKPDDISVTKFLDSQGFISEFVNQAEPTKYLEFTVIEFLGTSTAKFLEENDVSVTKFLDTALANFLLDDRAVSQMLEKNDISVTKFLGSALYNALQ